MSTSLRGKALLLDLDGTVFFKGAQVPGAERALARFRQMAVPLRFLTNIDSRTPATIATDLAAMGLSIAEADIFTPAIATLELLKLNPGKRCYCVLTKNMMSLFAPYVGGDGQVDYVIVGDCRDAVTYDMLDTGFRHLVAGAELIGLQKGRYFVRADGYHLDTGAFVTALEYASGRKARVMGKPSPDFFRMALAQMNCRAEDVVVVGDDVSTDVVGAKDVGALSILVRTGKYTSEALAQSPVQPDLLLDSIADVPGLFS